MRRIVAIALPEKRQRGEIPRLTLVGAANADLAGDCMYFDAATPAPQVGPKRMFALFFDDDGNVCADFAGNCFRREAEIRGGRNAQLHGSRNGFEIPVTVRAGISLNGDAA